MTYPPQEPPASGDPSAYDPNQPPPGYQPPPPGYQPGYQAGPPPGAPQYPGGQFPPSPPGYPPAGYGYPPPQAPWPPQGPFTAGESWEWSWAHVSKRLTTFVPPYLVWLLAIGVPFGIGYSILLASLPSTSTSRYGGDEYGGMSYSYETTSPGMSAGATILTIILYLAVVAVGLYMSASLLSANLDVADGKPVSFGTFFKARSFGAYVGTALLTGLGVLLGFVLCIIPGIIFGFLAQYAPYFTVERGLGPVDAIKASIQIVKNNLGPVILVFLITWLVGFVAQLGFILCGVGALFTMPVGMALTGLIHVYTYRRLTGGVIAPAPV